MVKPGRFSLVLFLSCFAFCVNAVDGLPKDHQGHQATTHIDKFEFVAVQSGLWLDETNWSGGEVPGPQATVLIPEGFSISITSTLNHSIDEIVVDGELLIPGEQSLKVAVGTIRINENGAFLVGSEDHPVAADNIVDIEFLGLQMNPTGNDDVSAGLVSMGRVELYGAEKSPYSVANNALKAGKDTFVFENMDGWKIGDQLLFPATELKHQDEVRTIVAIDEEDNRVEINRKLDEDHTIPDIVNTNVPVGNLTRNIRLSSREGLPLNRRAHTMFMNNQLGVVISGASFERMGRTDAKQTHTVPVTSDLPDNLVNTIGSYAIHFHIRSGADRKNKPHVVKNSIVTDCAKHGVVNHGGYVDATYNVTFKCNGSHFFAENGSELGRFEHNLAVRSNGSSDRFIDREASADFGHGGHGYWVQGGGGVEVRNNYAFGHSDAAYFYFGQYMLEDGKVVYFDAKNVNNRAVIPGPGKIWPRDIPIEFVGNVAVASTRGLDIWNHKERAKHDVPSLIKNSSFYANKITAIFIPYSKNIVIDNIVAIGNDDFRGIGLNTNVKTSGLDILNSYISGYAVGFQLPRHGVTTVEGLTLKNAINVRALSALSRDRKIEFKDLNLIKMPEWKALASQSLERTLDELRYLKRSQYDFYLEGIKPTERGDLSMVFEPTDIFVESGENAYVGKQIYFPEQAENVIPFEKLEVAELAGKTNRELWSEYKLAVGGAIAPSDSEKHSRVLGLVGDRASYLPPIPDQYFEVQPSVYKGNYLRDFDPKTYQEGWNFIPIELNGNTRTIMLYADSTKPSLELDPRVPLTIHPDDVQFGLRLQGDVIDYVGGIRTSNVVNREYRDLVVDEQGLINVEYPVVDAAGNINNVKYTIAVSESATRRGQDLAHYLRDAK